MKKLFIFAFTLLASSTYIAAQTKAGRIDTTKHLTFYSCLMKPTASGNQSDACATCGMELTLSGKERMQASLSNNFVCPVYLNVTSQHPAKCAKAHRYMTISLKEQMKAEVTNLFSCPIDAEMPARKHGNCAKCGTL